MIKKKGNRRKLVRYARWASKAAFLIFFVAPLAYFALAPRLPVYSFLFGGLGQPLFTLPFGQSVCSIETYAYGEIGPAAWLICPFGGLQVLVTGFVGVEHFLWTVLALLLFLVPVFLLGNFFCSWVCPLGTIIDSFDKLVSTFLRSLDAKRQKRFQHSKEKEAAKQASAMSTAACPTCPFGRLLNNKFGGVAASGIIISSLVGSAVLRFPVFCAVCPIGVITRGMFHLKAWTSITGQMMPILLELSVIPLAAVLLSLREKRFFCRKICPVGVTLNVAGSVSPLLKPKVDASNCIVKGCPKNCEDYHLGYCGACRQLDAKNCEKVCPQGINLVGGGSLVRCTKCFECYIECDRDAVRVEVVGKSEAYEWLKRLRNRKPKKPPVKAVG
ncbi:MAG: 4Fe-4S binding protein [Candidatus Bathyarchaeota archaeon]|nr:4Fe-4S binding protein [Candidatus Bathyarchaeota archaeon]